MKNTIRHEEPIADTDEVLLVINVDSSDDIYFIVMDIFIDGEAMGGSAQSRADKKPLLKPDKCYFTIKDGEDVKAGSDISKLSVSFFVADSPENIGNINSTASHEGQYKAGGEIKIDAEYGNTYYITISGDKKSGYKASLNNPPK